MSQSFQTPSGSLCCLLVVQGQGFSFSGLVIELVIHPYLTLLFLKIASDIPLNPQCIDYVEVFKVLPRITIRAHVTAMVGLPSLSYAYCTYCGILLASYVYRTYCGNLLAIKWARSKLEVRHPEVRNLTWVFLSSRNSNNS